MSYLVTFDEAVDKDLEDMPPDVRVRLFARADILTNNPRPGASRELTGKLRGYRRLRLGDYRVVYSIDEAVKEVTVWAIGHRRDVYEQFMRRGT